MNVTTITNIHIYVCNEVSVCVYAFKFNSIYLFYFRHLALCLFEKNFVIFLDILDLMMVTFITETYAPDFINLNISKFLNLIKFFVITIASSYSYINVKCFVKNYA